MDQLAWWAKASRSYLETYLTRDAARQDVFADIGMFYTPTRKHTNNDMLSPPLTHALHVLLAPVDYETQQRKMNEAGV